MIEEEIENLEQEKLAIENKLADSDVFTNPELLSKTNKEYVNIKNSLEKKNSEWEAKVLLLES